MTTKSLHLLPLLLLVLLLAAGCASSSSTREARAPDRPLPADRVSRVEELLKHHPGVQVYRSGGGYEIRVRGALQEPLFVVDGMPLTPHPGGGTLSVLSLYDVERVEVLTRPWELAAYGPRAGDGVVLITTKRGRRR